MARYIKMAWDCTYCDKKGIPGDVKHCPGCGNPCGSNIKFYVPKVKEYVDADVVPDGPDWQCEYCSSYNRCDYAHCGNCGASKDGTKNYFGKNTDGTADEVVEKTVQNTTSDPWVDRPFNMSKSVSNNAYFNLPRANTSNRREERVHTREDRSETIKMWLLGFAIFAIIAACIAGLIWVFTPKERELTVEGISWERCVDIYRYETVNESGWSLPSEARLQRRAQEIRSYDKVQDGYKTEEYTERVIDHYDKEVSYRDLGNGYAEEVVREVPVYKTVTKTRQVPKYKDVPVYDTKYYYEIDKYVYYRTERTQNSDKQPYWPENLPVEKAKPSIGDEKVAQRREKYMIAARLEDKDGLQEFTLNYSQWTDLNIGDTIKCKVYFNNSIEIINEEE